MQRMTASGTSPSTDSTGSSSRPQVGARHVDRGDRHPDRPPPGRGVERGRARPVDHGQGRPGRGGASWSCQVSSAATTSAPTTTKSLGARLGRRAAAGPCRRCRTGRPGRARCATPRGRDGRPGRRPPWRTGPRPGSPAGPASATGGWPPPPASGRGRARPRRPPPPRRARGGSDRTCPRRCPMRGPGRGHLRCRPGPPPPERTPPSPPRARRRTRTRTAHGARPAAR